MIAVGSSVPGSQPGVPGQGHRRKNRGRVLQVHGGHRGAVRRRPAEGHQGVEGVVGLRDRVGQDIAAAGRAPGRRQAVQSDENRRPATKVPQHTVARVPEQAVEPVDNTAGRHHNCKLAEILVGPRGLTQQYAQEVKLYANNVYDLGRHKYIVVRCNIKSNYKYYLQT